MTRIWDAIPYIQGFRDLLLISSDCLTVLLPSLFIILYFSLLSCLAPSKRGRVRMERKRTTMGEAAQIRYKSALPPMVYYPPWPRRRLCRNWSRNSRRAAKLLNLLSPREGPYPYFLFYFAFHAILSNFPKNCIISKFL